MSGKAIIIIMLVVVAGATCTAVYYQLSQPENPYVFKGAYVKLHAETTIFTIPYQITIIYEMRDLNSTHIKWYFHRYIERGIHVDETDLTYWLPRDYLETIEVAEQTAYLETIGTRDCLVTDDGYYYFDVETGWIVKETYQGIPSMTAIIAESNVKL